MPAEDRQQGLKALSQSGRHTPLLAPWKPAFVLGSTPDSIPIFGNKNPIPLRFPVITFRGNYPFSPGGARKAADSHNSPLYTLSTLILGNSFLFPYQRLLSDLFQSFLPRRRQYQIQWVTFTPGLDYPEILLHYFPRTPLVPHFFSHTPKLQKTAHSNRSPNSMLQHTH